MEGMGTYLLAAGLVGRRVYSGLAHVLHVVFKDIVAAGQNLDALSYTSC